MCKNLVLVSMLTASLCAQLVSPQSPLEQGDSSRAQFAMGPRYAQFPEKFFLLVRKGGAIGAIRFIRIEEDDLGNGKSTYESYFQGDGSGAFLGSNVVHRTGEIDLKPMRGVHASAWRPGQKKLWVGNWWFYCYSPSLVSMTSHFSEKDEGFEFAPTSAQTVAEIDANDKRLRWFRYDPDTRIEVPVSDLPK
jgi:hypothetical protein